jgi:hypothetical protein
MTEKDGLARTVAPVITATYVEAINQISTSQPSPPKKTDSAKGDLALELKKLESEHELQILELEQKQELEKLKIGYDQTCKVLSMRQRYSLKVICLVLLSVLIVVGLIGYRNPGALIYVGPSGLLSTIIGMAMKKRRDSEADNKHDSH